MREDTITALPDRNGFSADPLTDLIRTGARQLIEQALEAEQSALPAQFSTETTPEGHARIVRHGHLPEREVMTGVGPVAVKVPRARDRGQQAGNVRFTSLILLPYLRKAKSVEELLPWLSLKGTSTGDFQEALATLLGPNAAVCRPVRFPGSRRTGGTTMNAGNGAIAARGALSMSGPTACPSNRE